MALTDGGRVLIAERQVVEELPEITQGVHVVFKSSVGHAWENREYIMGQGACQPRDTASSPPAPSRAGLQQTVPTALSPPPPLRMVPHHMPSGWPSVHAACSLCKGHSFHYPGLWPSVTYLLRLSLPLSRAQLSPHPSLSIPGPGENSRHTFPCSTYFPVYCLTSPREYQLQRGTG